MYGIYEIKKEGTKFAAVYKLNIAAGETKTIYCGLAIVLIKKPFGYGFEEIFRTAQTRSR